MVAGRKGLLQSQQLTHGFTFAFSSGCVCSVYMLHLLLSVTYAHIFHSQHKEKLNTASTQIRNWYINYLGFYLLGTRISRKNRR